MWRPDGWNNNETQNMIKDAMKNGHIAGIQGNTMHDIYEAGADAMLEAVRGRVKRACESIPQSMDRLGGKGVWVFIPGEGGN